MVVSRTRTARTAPLLCLLLAGVVFPGLLAASVHAFGIARNDDWAYRRVLEEFARHGHFSLVGWGSMTLVGQVIWAAPFVLALGLSSWVPGISVAVLSLAGLAASYALARTMLSVRRAMICCFLLLIVPGFALNTTSFMTDLPAFAAAMGSLALGARAMRTAHGVHWPWLLASLAVGVFGFSVRDFDLAAPAAVLAVAVVRDRSRAAAYLVAGAATAAACGLIYWWTSLLPASEPKAFGWPTSGAAHNLLAAFFTTALLLSPFLPRIVRGKKVQPGAALVGVSAVPLVAGALVLLSGHGIILGNYLTSSGATGAQVLAGARPLLVPKIAWDLLEVVALLAGSALSYVLLAFVTTARVKTLRPKPVEVPKQLVFVFLSFCTVGLAAYALLVRAPLFDRYLWPIVFAACLLLAASEPRAHISGGFKWGLADAVPVLLAVGLGLLCCAITLNADSYDSARWRAGQLAVRLGYPATTIDAGFEWVGAHQRAIAMPGHGPMGGPPFEAWYDNLFPGFKDCAVVSGSPLDGSALQLLRLVSYKQFLLAGPEHLFIYGARLPGCPVPPRADLHDANVA